MKHQMRASKRRKRRKLKIVLSVIGVLFGAVVVFFALFYIREVEVLGNTRYTAEEVEEMALDGFLDCNSFILSTFHAHINLDKYPFMDSVDVEYLSRTKVRLHVTEKNPIGYVTVDDINYYFDVDGRVVEVITQTQTNSTDNLVDNSQDVSKSASEDVADNSPGGAVFGSSAEMSQGLDATAVGADGADVLIGETYVPALTDILRYEGLDYTEVKEGEILDVSDLGIFNTILALTRIIDKYEIEPDCVEVEGTSLTLCYGDTRIGLGTDTNLEEKITRAAAILPQIQGTAGVLHLENFSEDTQNIVFDPS